MWFVSISLFLHITRMDNNADAKEIITAVSLDDWKRPPGHRRFTFRQSMMTLSPTISYWLRQSSWRLQLWLALCSAGDTNEKLTWKFINMILVMPSSDGRCLFSHLIAYIVCLANVHRRHHHHYEAAGSINRLLVIRLLPSPLSSKMDSSRT